MTFLDKRKLIEITPDKIMPNPAQPRTDFDEDGLMQLAESIRQNGVLQPVLVRRERDHYVLIAGERRWRACKLAGVRTVPAIVQEISIKDGAVLALIENLQRRDLHFFEEAAAIYGLMQDRSMTQEETARRIGMSQPALANKIRLLRLSGEEQRIITEQKLTERHARALLRIEDNVLRMQILRKITEQKWNVTKTEEYITRLIESLTEKKPKRTFVAKDIRLFLNTIDHAVKAMKDAGIRAVSQKRETEDCFEYVVRIPKSNSSAR